MYKMSDNAKRHAIQFYKYTIPEGAKPEDAPKDAKKEDTKDDNVVDADFEEVKDENKEKSA